MGYEITEIVECNCSNPYFVIGLVMAIVISCWINSWMRSIRDNEKWDLSKENRIKGEDFKRAFRMHHISPEKISSLGTMEVIFYYISIYFNQYPLIAAWLAFKVASKWNTWSTIAKIPDHLQDVNGYDYLEAKNLVATITLQRWLLGNLSNILGAILSLFLSYWLIKLFCLCQYFCY